MTAASTEATVSYLAKFAAELQESRAAEHAALAALADAVEEAHAGGMTKYRIGQVTGLARGTIDKWAAGKR